jgi:uncharacterized membrane protein YgdD (TMEM256/DUF423 family)
MMPRTLLTRISACFGFLAVVLGAFGAHLLEKLLAANGNTQVWHTAVLYHLTHSVAALWASTKYPLASKLWLVGVALFSGSLYLLAITNLRWLGPITPIGGVLLIAGWLAVILGKENSAG